MFDRCASDGEDAGGGLLARGELVGAAGVEAGDDDMGEYVVVQAAEARSASALRPAARGWARTCSWRAAVLSWVRPGRGYPDQSTPLVGQGEEVQAVMVVFAGVVPPVGLSGAALGGDEGAVDQDHLPALPGDLLQGAVQSLRLHGEQGDQLVAPAAVGELGRVVAAAMSARRRSWRSTARTITAIFPGGRIRHLDRITFR
ncbi:hypothetical protein GCM10010360_15990 [Streptomyces nogalater]